MYRTRPRFIIEFNRVSLRNYIDMPWEYKWGETVNILYSTVLPTSVIVVCTPEMTEEMISLLFLTSMHQYAPHYTVKNSLT